MESCPGLFDDIFPSSDSDEIDEDDDFNGNNISTASKVCFQGLDENGDAGKNRITSDSIGDIVDEAHHLLMLEKARRMSSKFNFLPHILKYNM